MPVSVDEMVKAALSPLEEAFSKRKGLSAEQIAKDLEQEARVARQINKDKEVDPRIRLQAGRELRENRIAVAKMLGWMEERYRISMPVVDVHFGDVDNDGDSDNKNNI